MKIKAGDTPGVNQIDLSRASSVRQLDATQTSEPNSASRVPAGDSIALSQISGFVQTALTSGSAARAARVAELQKLYQSGQYQPDAGAVASALIDAHLAGE